MQKRKPNIVNGDPRPLFPCTRPDISDEPLYPSLTETWETGSSGVDHGQTSSSVPEGICEHRSLLSQVTKRTVPRWLQRHRSSKLGKSTQHDRIIFCAQRGWSPCVVEESETINRCFFIVRSRGLIWRSGSVQEAYLLSMLLTELKTKEPFSLVNNPIVSNRYKHTDIKHHFFQREDLHPVTRNKLSIST